MTGLRAVILDLDDTLFPQADYLSAVWATVAEEGSRLGADGPALHAALLEICALGSDRGHIIDHALDLVAASPSLVVPLVEAFRAFRPLRLASYPGVPAALDRLGNLVRLACVTDGDGEVQRAKLAALGLTAAFETIVVSDELDRRLRKPHPAPFRRALGTLGVGANDTVHVGDRPDKDVAGAHAAGLRAVRVRQGEYAQLPDAPPGHPAPWASFGDVNSALEFLCAAAVPNGKQPPRSGVVC